MPSSASLLKHDSEGAPKALLADSLKKDGAPAAAAAEIKALLAEVDREPLTAYSTVAQTSASLPGRDGGSSRSPPWRRAEARRLSALRGCRAQRQAPDLQFSAKSGVPEAR